MHTIRNWRSHCAVDLGRQGLCQICGMDRLDETGPSRLLGAGFKHS
jgi:hypothetical protein